MPEYIYGKLKTTGEIISIKDIPNDKAQRDSWACVCPKCGVDLIPKKGEVRVHHFAHERAIGCNAASANETALHQMAKEIIKEERKICIPQKVIFQNDLNLKLPHYIAKKLPKYYLIQSESILDCEDVKIEERISDFQPDAVVISHRKTYFIEFWNSHKTDEDKLKKVAQYGYCPMLEIDIRSFVDISISKQELRKFLVSESHSREWIYYPNEFKLREQARVYFESFKIVKNYRIESAKQAIREKINRKITEQKEKKRKEEEEQQRREFLKKQQIVDELFQPERYKQELNSNKRINYSKAIFESFHFYNQNIPFFINIPITGEIVFKCDRRVWQASIFDKWIYCGDKSQVINFDNIFDELPEFVPVDERLLGNEFTILGERNLSLLPHKVIGTYMGYLEFIGFIRVFVEGKRARVSECLNIVPPNTEHADKLQEIIKNLGDNKDAVNVDELIQEKVNIYQKDKRNKEVAWRELPLEEKLNLLLPQGDENMTGWHDDGCLWVKCSLCGKIVPFFNDAIFIDENTIECCHNCLATKNKD